MTSVAPYFESYAFSVVGWRCATGYYSFAHEMGHNMGSHHDRANASGPGAYDYSHGYQAPDEAFRTIMAYNCPGECPRVNYWSNPAVSYGGQPTGVVHTAPDSADNRRSLNNTAYTVANFRSAIAQTVQAPSNLRMTNASPTQIDLAWDDNSDNEEGFQIERSLDGSHWSVLAAVGENATQIQDGSLSCGTTYHYRVRAYSGSTYSDYSNQTSPSTAACGPYSISGHVRNRAGAGIGGVSISFGALRPPVVTDGSGHYVQTGFIDGAYLITALAYPGYAFSPAMDRATIGGGDATHDVTGYLYTATAMPVTDTFEGGTLGSGWAITSGFGGRAIVSSTYPHNGAYSLLVDDGADGSGSAYACAIVGIDPSERVAPELSFQWRSVGGAGSTGSVSVGAIHGGNWSQVFDFYSKTSYSQTTVELRNAISALGLGWRDPFLIGFCAYDVDSGTGNGGYAIDDVRVDGNLVDEKAYLPAVARNDP